MKNGKLRIGIGADHGGVELKGAIREALAADGMDVVDFGTNDTESVDYPDYAADVARAVAEGRFDFGVLVCRSGIGMSIAANRVRGVRAARVCSVEDARITRGHNDANVLCLGSGTMNAEEAVALVMRPHLRRGVSQRCGILS